MKRARIVIDPHEGIVPDEEHDYVDVEIVSENEALIKWVMELLGDETVSWSEVEDC